MCLVWQEEARCRSGREHAALLRRQVQQHEEHRRQQASLKAAEGAAHRLKLEQEQALLEVRWPGLGQGPAADVGCARGCRADVGHRCRVRVGASAAVESAGLSNSVLHETHGRSGGPVKAESCRGVRVKAALARVAGSEPSLRPVVLMYLRSLGHGHGRPAELRSRCRVYQSQL